MHHPINQDSTFGYRGQRPNAPNRADLAHALEEMGVSLYPSSFELAFARMQEAADQSGEVSDERIKGIVDEVISGMEILQGVADSFR